MKMNRQKLLLSILIRYILLFRWWWCGWYEYCDGFQLISPLQRVSKISPPSSSPSSSSSPPPLAPLAPLNSNRNQNGSRIVQLQSQLQLQGTRSSSQRSIQRCNRSSNAALQLKLSADSSNENDIINDVGIGVGIGIGDGRINGLSPLLSTTTTTSAKASISASIVMEEEEDITTITTAITNDNYDDEDDGDSDYDYDNDTSEFENNVLTLTIEQVEKQQEELLQSIQNYKDSTTTTTTNKTKPPLEAFTSLIENWLYFPKPEKAEYIIDTMEELYHVSGRVYERVINAWSFEAIESNTNVLLLQNEQEQEQDGNENTNDHKNDHDNGEGGKEAGDDKENNVAAVPSSSSSIPFEKRTTSIDKEYERQKNIGINAAKRAYNLLNRMEQLHEATGDLDFRPTLSTYTSVINAIKRSSSSQLQSQPSSQDVSNANVNANTMIEKIRQQRDRVYNQSDIDHMDLISPHQVFYVLKYLDTSRSKDTWAKLKKKRVMNDTTSTSRSTSTSKSKSRRTSGGKPPSTGNDDDDDDRDDSDGNDIGHDNDNDQYFIPTINRYNFNIIINELANEGKPWAAQAAEEILDCMIHCHVSTYPQLKPNIETINACMNAWASSSSSSANNVISSGSGSGIGSSNNNHNNNDNNESDEGMNRDYFSSAERAEGILKKLNELQMNEGLLLDVTPDVVSYNSIVKAYANSGNAKKAEEVLNIMEDLYQSTGDTKIRPDIISFSSVLNAFAKAAKYDQSASRTAERILMRMIKEQRARVDGNDSPIVNVWCFNSVLNAYAAQGAGLRAILLLQLMEDMAKRDGNDLVRPDTYSFNTVLKALANSKERGSINKAMQILLEMEERSAKGDWKVRPDGVSYNTVILAIANNRGRGSGRSAERILHRMERQYYNGHLASKPTSATYTSLIKAWTSEKASTRRAEEIVNRLRKPNKGKIAVAPDTSIYNALLNCYAKSGERNSAERAERIIQTMLQEYAETGDETVKPNFRTYTTAIDVYSKSQEKGIEEKALGILEQMERLSREGEAHLLPNAYTYSAVINCFARSKEPDKAVKAVSVLQQMEEQYRLGNNSARPNVVAYNSVLNACAYTVGEQENIDTAFKIACLVFDEVRTSDYTRPTHITYGTFIQVCGNFMPESKIRENLIEATFKRCAQEGLVSNLVWKKLRLAASSELFQALQETAAKDNNEAKWSRNT